MNRPIVHGILTSWIAMAICLPGQAAEQQQAHIVFFRLKQSTHQSREKLVAACDKYLSGHRGVVYYSAGTVADDMQRGVNVRDWDVSLHVVFANKAAHQRYQTAPRHLQFVKENQSLWESVRVFDSYVNPRRGPGARRSRERTQRQRERSDQTDRRIALPDPAANFAGMVRGRVVAKRDDGQVLLRVQKVAEVWEHSRAEDPQTLVGKAVLIRAGKAEGDSATPIGRFLMRLKTGKSITVDVAHQHGEALTVIELTAEQREPTKTE